MRTHCVPGTLSMKDPVTDPEHSESRQKVTYHRPTRVGRGPGLTSRPVCLSTPLLQVSL